MNNEGISHIGLAKVNINWIEIPIKENIYNSTYGWFKTSKVSTGYKQVTNFDGPFQSWVIAIIEVD